MATITCKKCKSVANVDGLGEVIDSKCFCGANETYYKTECCGYIKVLDYITNENTVDSSVVTCDCGENYLFTIEKNAYSFDTLKNKEYNRYYYMKSVKRDISNIDFKINKLENTVNSLTKTVKRLLDLIEFAPGAPGAIEAANSFAKHSASK